MTEIFSGTDDELRELCRALDEITDEVSLTADRVEGVLLECAKLRKEYGELQANVQPMWGYIEELHEENRVLREVLDKVRKEAMEDGESLSPWLYDEVCAELNKPRNLVHSADLCQGGE